MSTHVAGFVEGGIAKALAERLVQPEGQWQPFERRGWRAVVCPRPARPSDLPVTIR